jgi:4-hydroxybenzoate polyprenyltransferase
MFDASIIWTLSLGVMAFCFASSFVYVVNDVMDAPSDRLHEKKRNRPVASGEVSVTGALILAAAAAAACAACGAAAGDNAASVAILLTYALFNILYSFRLKQVPLLDLAILSSGFLLRVFYAQELAGIEISRWFYLVIMSFSFYMGIAKRRGEIRKNGTASRAVLRHYPAGFLDNNLYVCQGLTVVFYSLWCLEKAGDGGGFVIWTIPLVILILMRYSMLIESENSSGDPVDVVYGDMTLTLMSLAYIFSMYWMIYVSKI